MSGFATDREAKLFYLLSTIKGYARGFAETHPDLYPSTKQVVLDDIKKADDAVNEIREELHK